MSTRKYALYYYSLSAALMTVYGGLVCPFVDSLPFWHWALIIIAGYVLLFFARSTLEQRYVCTQSDFSAGKRQFILDLTLTIVLGLALTAFDTIVFSFPAGSGFKVLLSTTCFGFFMALDMTLERERRISLAANGRFASDTSQQQALPFTSLTRRISLLASIVVGFNTTLIALVVFKDLIYLQTLSADMMQRAAIFIALEIVFVSLTILSFTLRVVWSYARNLRMAFHTQTSTLEAVRNGNLDVHVPIISHDEFGIIARHTNLMISGLQEKQRIRSLLGKVVDSRIADQLIHDSAQGITLGGTRRNVIILMSDIRNFTTFSETAEPEIVVEDLNTYFSTCVQIVTDHGGMVDKFIGDGMLAVFGLVEHAENEVCTCHDNALRAAIAITGQLAQINPRLSKAISIGIGIHAGHVVSGLVGSPDRLEFTVIGDTVNTAARLESLSKTLHTSIVISDTVYKAIADADLRAQLEFAGEHMLKGKRDAVGVWTVKTKA